MRAACNFSYIKNAEIKGALQQFLPPQVRGLHWNYLRQHLKCSTLLRKNSK